MTADSQNATQSATSDNAKAVTTPAQSATQTAATSQSEKAPQSGSQTITVNVKDLQNGNANPASLQDSKAVTETDLQRLENLQDTLNQYRTSTVVRTITLNKPSGTETHTDSVLFRAMIGASSNAVINGTTTVGKIFVIQQVVSGKPVITKYQFHFAQDTGEIVSNDEKEQFNKLMNLKPSDYTFNIPALDPSKINVDGYTSHITSATPNGATTGAETYHIGDPVQKIVIDYVKNPVQNHSVTFQFVDQDKNNANVGTLVTVSGEPGKSVAVSGLNIPANYHLVSGQLPTSVTIGDSDQNLTIPLKHNTQNVNDSKTITRTINVTNPEGKVNPTPQTVTLNRTGVKDLVTNNTTWQNWNTGNWAQFTTPTIAGYTPSQASVAGQAVDINTQNSIVNINYTADPQKAAVQYIDDTDNKTVATQELNGHTGETSNYSTAAEISNLEKQGYVLVSDNYPKGGLVFDNNDRQDQTIEVHLKHGMKTVDQNNVPDGYTQTDFTMPVKRTITAKEPSGNVDLSQSATLTRTGTYDLVTKKITQYSGWSTTSFDQVSAPRVPGYAPSQATVPPESTVTSDYKDPNIVITYIRNDATIQITGQSTVAYGSPDWLNDIQGNVPTTGITVKVTPKVNVGTIKDYQPQPGDLQYVQTPGNVGTYQIALTDQGLANLKKFYGDDYTYPEKASDVTSQAALTVTPGTQNITLTGKSSKSYDQKSDLPANFNSNFKYDGNNGQVTIYKADGTPVTFTVQPSDLVFKVNGRVVDQTTAIQAGTYQVDLSDAAKQKLTTAAGQNYKTTIQTTATYTITPDASQGTLSGTNEKDWTGNQVTTAEVTKDGKIAVKVATKNNGDFTYTLQNGDYTWPNGTAPSDGGSYTVNLNKDELVKHIQAQLNQKYGVGQDGQGNVQIKADDLSGTATFNINTKVTYKFVDDDNHGQPVGNDVVTKSGVNGSSVDTGLTLPSGYELVSLSALPTTVKLTGQNQMVTIHLKHGTVTVTPGHPGKPGDPIDPQNPDGPKYPAGTDAQSLQKDVKRTINYTYSNGKHSDTSTTDSLRFTETKVIDNVTGKVTQDTWSPAQNFKTVTTPAVAGYTPDQKAVSNTGITHDHPAITETVTYSPDPQKTTVTYVDQNGNEIKSPDNQPVPGSHYEVDGHTDKEVSTNVQKDVPTGWHITDSKTPDKITFTAGGYPKIKVHVDHDTTTVQPNNPKTPTDELPDNPGHHYPSGVDHDSLNRTITRHITVKNPNGTIEHHDQTVHLTRMATVDEVTGEVTHYSDWTTGNFPEYVTPVIPGYTTTQPSVEPVTKVTVDYQDPNVLISYTPNPQSTTVTYVDQDGHEIKNPDGTPINGSHYTINGHTDDKNVPTKVKDNIPTGWHITDPKTTNQIDFGPDGYPAIVVHVDHNTTTVQPNDPKTPADELPDNPDHHYPKGVDRDDLNRTITRHITVINPDGTQEQHDQTITLTRIATVDEVSGKVTYGSWTTGSFGEYDAPAIPGYTINGYAPATTVTADSDFSPIVITYSPIPQGRGNGASGISGTASANGGLNGQDLTGHGSANTNDGQLPQTGNAHNEAAVTLAGILTGMLGLAAGFGSQRRRHEK